MQIFTYFLEIFKMVEYLEEKMPKMAGKKKVIRDKYDDTEVDRQFRALRTYHRGR